MQCTFVVAFAIISEASLSFLGAGVDPETPTWGNMLRDGQRVLQRAWWLALFPGIALVLTVLTLNLLGDALRDALGSQGEGTVEGYRLSAAGHWLSDIGMRLFLLSGSLARREWRRSLPGERCKGCQGYER